MSSAASTLFHFTGKNKKSVEAIDIIVAILKEGFRPSYCPEVLEAELTPENVHDHQGIAFIPMVCFCDIRLSQIKNHVANYGEYGIGLKKGFTNQFKLNPVHYINNRSDAHKNSSMSLIPILYAFNEDNLLAFISDLSQGNPVPIYTEKTKDVIRIMKDLPLAMIKSTAMQKRTEGLYLEKEGIINRKIYETDIRSFYDEREWRHIPEMGYEKIIVQKERFIDGQQSYDQSIQENLKFEIDGDLNYIILNKKEDLTILSQKLDEKLDEKQIANKDLILTKVRFLQEIENDF